MKNFYKPFSGESKAQMATFALLIGCALLSLAGDKNWPGFRGLAQSSCSDKNLPLNWTIETVPTWRSQLAGIGQSSPVVWEDQVYITSVEGPNKETLHLESFEVATGKKLWSKTWGSSFPEKDSDYISKAAPTPVVDVDRLYVLFESGDLIALSHKGEELWRRELTKDYGKFEGNHGQASSPVLTDDGVIILVDQKAQSFIASFDKNSGETQWKTDRDTSTAWSTPIVLNRGGRTEVITSASGSLTAYDPKNGKELWTHLDLDGNNVPSPSTDGNLFLIGSRKKGANLAIRAGDAKTEVAWIAEDATSAFGSPLIHAGRAYYVSDAGIAFCYRLETGEPLWDERIGDGTWASPLAAGDRVYFFGKNGKTTVIKPSDSFESIAENEIEVDPKDRVYGYAVADGKFIMRLGGELVCLAR